MQAIDFNSPRNHLASFGLWIYVFSRESITFFGPAFPFPFAFSHCQQCVRTNGYFNTGTH